MKVTYGISIAIRDGMLLRQGGCCAICRCTIELGKDQVCVDHDHETGQVRKLLCRKCNLGLGAFNDNPGLLRLAAEYVEAHHG